MLINILHYFSSCTFFCTFFASAFFFVNEVGFFFFFTFLDCFTLHFLHLLLLSYFLQDTCIFYIILLNKNKLILPGYKEFDMI